MILGRGRKAALYLTAIVVFWPSKVTFGYFNLAQDSPLLAVSAEEVASLPPAYLSEIFAQRAQDYCSLYNAKLVGFEMAKFVDVVRLKTFPNGYPVYFFARPAIRYEYFYHENGGHPPRRLTRQQAYFIWNQGQRHLLSWKIGRVPTYAFKTVWCEDPYTDPAHGVISDGAACSNRLKDPDFQLIEDLQNHLREIIAQIEREETKPEEAKDKVKEQVKVKEQEKEKVEPPPLPPPFEELETPSDAALTAALGLSSEEKDHHNLCFSNAALKLMMDHPQVLELRAEKIKKRDEEGEAEFKARKKLAGSFYSLMNELVSRKNKVMSGAELGGEKLRSKMKNYINNYNGYLKEYNFTNKHGSQDGFFSKDRKNKKYLGTNQMDSSEYLIRTLEILDDQNSVSRWKTATVRRFESGEKTVGAPASDVQVTVSAKNNASIEEALAQYFKKETAEDVKNSKNEQERSESFLAFVAEKTDDIPKQLIVTLKRTDYDAAKKKEIKITSLVGGSDSINVPYYLSKTLSDYKNSAATLPAPQTKKMVISSVVVHDGATAARGHYVTYTRENGRWYKHNDNVVTAVTDEEAKKDIAENGYQFLYLEEPAQSSQTEVL